jgi:hypothetical protein
LLATLAGRSTSVASKGLKRRLDSDPEKIGPDNADAIHRTEEGRHQRPSLLKAGGEGEAGIALGLAWVNQNGNCWYTPRQFS